MVHLTITREIIALFKKLFLLPDVKDYNLNSQVPINKSIKKIHADRIKGMEKVKQLFKKEDRNAPQS